MTLPAAFWAKTSTTDCIIWSGAQNSKGYGCFAVMGVSRLAHRLAWEDAHGRIPEGLTVDHACRVRACVNVDHMELVSIAENNRRKRALNVGLTCIHEHVISSEVDIYRPPNGGAAECRACRRAKPHHRADDTPTVERRRTA